MIQRRAGLVHLIGSVPLASTEEVFRTLVGALGDRLSRMPDGETGERRRWIWWQRTMLERHPAMEVDRETAPIEIRQWDGSLLRRSELFRLRQGVNPEAVDVRDRLRRGRARFVGAVRGAPARRRDSRRACAFRSACPRPMSSAFMYVSPRSHDDYMRAYERALLRALAEIVAKVPARRSEHPVGHLPGSAGVRDLLRQPPRRLQGADLRAAGAPRRRRSARSRARLSPLLRQPRRSAPRHAARHRDPHRDRQRRSSRAPRRVVDFLHLPVPRERDDVAYFAPLRELRLPGHDPALPRPDPLGRRRRRPPPHRHRPHA